VAPPARRPALELSGYWHDAPLLDATTVELIVQNVGFMPCGPGAGGHLSCEAATLSVRWDGETTYVRAAAGCWHAELGWV
jgi:hypothetical protein